MAAAGTAINHHRRDGRATATTSAAIATVCTSTGSHPSSRLTPFGYGAPGGAVAAETTKAPIRMPPVSGNRAQYRATARSIEQPRAVSSNRALSRGMRSRRRQPWCQNRGWVDLAARGTSEPRHTLNSVLIGSHVHSEDPLAAADADGAEVVQFFLGDPQSWKKPKPREDAQTLKASSMPLYVHAPYLINVASANNRVRIPSRKILQDTCDAASEINATAVIVHGGHADDNDMEAGFERWVKALASLETDVAVYLENTAGGDHAMGRPFD